MLKKIKNLLHEMMYSSSGTATLVLLIMLFVTIFNFVNVGLLFSNNAFILPMLALSFALPFLLFVAKRGGKKYKFTNHLALPKKHHIPTIIFSVLLLAFGSTLLKLAFINEKYVEFPLYNAFFAHRNGNLFTDLYLVIAFCIIPPVLEGIVFRGIMLKEHDKCGRMTTTVFSAFFFSLLTFSFELFIPTFFVGVILCMIVFATESLATAIAIHIAFNFFAVFVEPTFVSVKTVSANYELFTFIIAILALVSAILLLSQLSKLYQKYSHDKFGKNTKRSMPIKRTLWNLLELALSIPSIACYVLFIVVTIVLRA